MVIIDLDRLQYYLAFHYPTFFLLNDLSRNLTVPMLRKVYFTLLKCYKTREQNDEIQSLVGIPE